MAGLGAALALRSARKTGSRTAAMNAYGKAGSKGVARISASRKALLKSKGYKPTSGGKYIHPKSGKIVDGNRAAAGLERGAKSGSKAASKGASGVSRKKPVSKAKRSSGAAKKSASKASKGRGTLKKGPTPKSELRNIKTKSKRDLARAKEKLSAANQRLADLRAQSMPRNSPTYFKAQRQQQIAKKQVKDFQDLIADIDKKLAA